MECVYQQNIRLESVPEDDLTQAYDEAFAKCNVGGYHIDWLIAA